MATDLTSSGPVLQNPETVLVASFTALMALDVQKQTWQTIHEGRGKYFGMAVLDKDRLVVVSRPDGALADDLLVFDRVTAALIEAIRLPSTDTHQIRRHGHDLYVTSTGTGQLLKLDIDQLDQAQPPTIVCAFDAEDHVNSVFVSDDQIAVLLHKFGPSQVVWLSLPTGREIRRHSGIGRNSHDIEPWNDQLIVCGSAEGSVLQVGAEGNTRVIWHNDETFTKGLAVLDGVALVGQSAPSTRIKRWTLPVTIVALDLASGALLDTVPVPAPGLVNAIAQVSRLDADC